MDQVATIDVVNQPPTRNTSKRLIDDEVAVVTERGEKGASSWKETVVVVSEVIPIFDKLEAMVTEVQRMVKLVKQDLLNRSVQTSGAQDPTNIVLSKAEPSNEELERKVIEDVIEHMKGSFLRAARGTKAVNEVDSSVSASAVEVQLPLGRLPIAIRHKRAHNDGTADDSNADKLTNCNDPKLKQIIIENIQKDAPTSKRAIQKAAELEFGGTFDVVCSPCEFSFVISSQKYCDGIKDEVACFVFLQPPGTLAPK
uniref:Ground-like domain-containing protein n=1 Tax=Haemonchus contortus TaxID=6289 RepID=A0A7I4YXW9_HAECO